jgi:hypothetical protein
MTEVPPTEQYAWRASSETRAEEQMTDAEVRARARERNAGWVRFAAVILALIGVFQIVTGLSALTRRETFLVPEDRLILNVDYAAWGWLYIVLGGIALAAAVGVHRRLPWARIVGVCLAVLSAASNLAFLPVRPFTAATIIILNVLAIYGITVHGDRTGTHFYADRA